jgi:Domain of unknown function (DUF4440)
MKADDLAALERRRLRALVDVDLDVANELHAEGFQLITPAGVPLSKDEYLQGVASGDVDYLVWEPEEIESFVHEDAGCVRYRSTIHIRYRGEEAPPARYWHTDYYERRHGRWQVVWSQATAASPDVPPNRESRR